MDAVDQVKADLASPQMATGIFGEDTLALSGTLDPKDVYEQARRYYMTSLSAERPSGSKTPQPGRPENLGKTQQTFAHDALNEASLTTNSHELGEDTHRTSQEPTSGRASGRRLRSHRSRGKTPTATSSYSSRVQPACTTTAFKGISTMDDFANMLLAKHQAVVEQTSKPAEENSPRVMQGDCCTPRIVTEKEVELVCPPTEEVKIDQFNGQKSIAEEMTPARVPDYYMQDYESSPERKMPESPTVEEPSSPMSPENHQDLDEEEDTQECETVPDESPEDSYTQNSFRIQPSPVLHVPNQQPLHSIQEFNESKECTDRQPLTSPSRHIDYTSVNYESTLLEENQDLSSPMSLVKAPAHKVEIVARDVSQSVESPLQYEESQPCESPDQSEDNFGQHSPIKSYPEQEDDRAVLSPMTGEAKSEEEQSSKKSEVQEHSSMLPSPMKDCESPSGESFQLRGRMAPLESTGGLLQMLREQHSTQLTRIAEEHQNEVSSLRDALREAQQRVRQMETTACEKSETVQISLQREHSLQDEITKLQDRLSSQQADYETQIRQLMDNHAKAMQQLTTEFEQSKLALHNEANQKLQQVSTAYAQAQDQMQQLQQAFGQKEAQATKFRTDNQNMFADLKALAQNEEALKCENHELHQANAELEKRCYQQNEQLKAMQMQFQEQYMQAQQQAQEQVKQTASKCEALKGQLVQAQSLINEATKEAEHGKRELQTKDQQLAKFIAEMDNLREQNIMLANKAQQLEQERLNNATERERKNQELRSMHAELQKMSNAITGLKQMQNSGAAFDTSMHMQRQVLQQNDLNMHEWGQQVPVAYGQERPASPFKKSSTPHGTTPSPLKGRMDPNMPQVARRNMQVDFETSIQTMNLRQLKDKKVSMEAEYARIPITITGKSLQVRKRKEELEYELDLIDKHIQRVGRL